MTIRTLWSRVTEERPPVASAFVESLSASRPRGDRDALSVVTTARPVAAVTAALDGRARAHREDNRPRANDAPERHFERQGPARAAAHDRVVALARRRSLWLAVREAHGARDKRGVRLAHGVAPRREHRPRATRARVAARAAGDLRGGRRTGSERPQVLSRALLLHPLARAPFRGARRSRAGEMARWVIRRSVAVPLWMR